MGRKLKTRFIIYKIWWPWKGYYYGKTMGFRKRKNRHLREMLDGTHHNQNLINYRLLHGEPRIQILAHCVSEEAMNELERELIAANICNRQCLNLKR